MKRFTLFFMALLACIMASAQSGLPDFSTEDSPIYYPVKFKTGGNYLADKGAGNKMQTVASESDATNFQLIGTQASFIMKSKSGNYVGFSGERFITTTKANAVKMAIINGSASKYYELKRASESKCMNQWAGTSAGVELGEYNVGDGNNQLYFVGAEGTLAELQTEYNNLVGQLQAAAGYKYFYRDATEAVKSIPSTEPTTKEGYQTAINAMKAALATLNSGEVLGTDIEGKHFFLAKTSSTLLSLPMPMALQWVRRRPLTAPTACGNLRRLTMVNTTSRM